MRSQHESVATEIGRSEHRSLKDLAHPGKIEVKVLVSRLGRAENPL